MPKEAAALFDQMKPMQKHLKKSKYEENMKMFRSEHGDYFERILSEVGCAEDQEAACNRIAGEFTDSVKAAFSKNGKIRGTLQVDLNLFMVFYVFPAILLTEDENAGKIADAICAAWENAFPGNKIRYTDYESLHGKFREKFLGIF